MSKSLDLKFLYHFSHNALHVLEVKINGLPEGTPPGKVYHWLYCDQTEIQKLEFNSMGSQDNRDYRKFIQGELWFDTSQAELKLQTQQLTLSVQDPHQVPAKLTERIHKFLDQTIST